MAIYNTQTWFGLWCIQQGIDLNRMRVVEPPVPPTQQYTARITVDIDGELYTGDAVLSKQV